MAKKPYVIALEEHYQDPEVKQLGAGPGAGREIVERLDDLGALRIREMDAAGIDLQVLSHSIPGLQAVDAEAGPPLARRTNDRLYEAVQRPPIGGKGWWFATDSPLEGAVTSELVSETKFPASWENTGNFCSSGPPSCDYCLGI